MLYHVPNRNYLLAISLVIFQLTGCQSNDGQAPSSSTAMEVTVVTLKEQPVSLTTELPGRTVAFRKAEVRPQVSGILEKRLFDEGGQVEAGQQLYQIAPERYKAAVQTANANVAKAKANLATAEARENRYRGLLAQKVISQQDYDDALTAYQQAQADSKVAHAALETAQIDLNYTRVTAPISGRIGKSSVTEGALVSAQQTNVLATIHQLDPIYVDLAESAKQILELRRQIVSGAVSVNQSARVQLTLEDGSVYQHPGELKFSEMSVDESTGTVVVRAMLPNPEHMLLPGMFVRAQIQEGTRRESVLVPQRGVSRDREGNATVMLVNAENKVEPRELTISRSIGNDWLVESGLEAGDKVIVEGLQKIAPGMPVNPVELASTSKHIPDLAKE